MEKQELTELANAVAIVEYYNAIIENAKEKIRSLSNEEVEKINKTNLLQIKRQDYTKTIYSNEYKEAIKEIAEKYPPTKETLTNHTIKLTSTNYTKSKSEIIIEQIATQNKTILKQMAKLAK